MSLKEGSGGSKWENEDHHERQTHDTINLVGVLAADQYQRRNGITARSPRGPAFRAGPAAAVLVTESAQASPDRSIQILDPPIVVRMDGPSRRVVIEVLAAVINDAIGSGAVGDVHDRRVAAEVQRAGDLTGPHDLHFPA